jgi:hypothetical protein
MQAAGDHRKGKPRHRNRNRGRGRGRGPASPAPQTDVPPAAPTPAPVPPLLRWVLNLSLAGVVPRSAVYQAVAHLCHLEMLLEEGKENELAFSFRSVLEGSVDRSGALDFLALCTDPVAPPMTSHGESGADDGARSEGAGADDGARSEGAGAGAADTDPLAAGAGAAEDTCTPSSKMERLES